MVIISRIGRRVLLVYVMKQLSVSAEWSPPVPVFHNTLYAMSRKKMDTVIFDDKPQYLNTNVCLG